MTTTTRNDADTEQPFGEEQLRRRFRKWEYGQQWLDALDLALAAERRATVERIAKRMEDFRGEEDERAMAAAGPSDDELSQDVNWNKGYAYHAIGMAAILDEEAGFPETLRTPDENVRLLKRLDEWIPAHNPGPLIRWAAAHLRVCMAVEAEAVAPYHDALRELVEAIDNNSRVGGVGFVHVIEANARKARALLAATETAEAAR